VRLRPLRLSETLLSLSFAFAGLVLSIGYASRGSDWLPWVSGGLCTVLLLACLWHLRKLLTDAN
jgi:hypothetical protein